MDKRIEYNYCTEHHCHHGDPLEKFRESFMNSQNASNKAYFNMLLQYIKQALGNYDSATEKAIRDIEKGFETLGDNPSLQQVSDNIVFNLLKNWDKNFIRQQTKDSKESVDFIYRQFRADKSIFTKDFGDVVDAVFGVIDQRTVDYFSNSDSYYLGKFITDEDTIRRISKFIDEEYIANNLPIGSNKDKAALAAFREKFGDVLKGEDWKINRVIATTVNRLRNAASVNYLSQAEVEEFEIRGINDRLQCPYCAAMQGRRFKVSIAADRVDQTVRSNPELVGIDSPFITSVYKKPEDMENISDEELQSQGIDLPPYHPHCRDRAIAVF